MSRVFEKIPEWITERSRRELNQVVSDEKTTRVKLALHASHERQTDFVIMELADDSFFIPAIFKPDEIRKKFGLSDLSLSIEALEERLIKIKTYAVSAYRSNSNLYPYLIVTDFEHIKGRSRIDGDLQHVYTVKQVKDWIDHVQQSLHNLHNPVSKLFPSSALLTQYHNLAALECHLEAILPRMYKFEPRNNTREMEHSSSMPNCPERGNNTSDTTYNHANHEQLAATTPMIEWHPSDMHQLQLRADTHSRAPPADDLTLQAYLLSTFDTMDEIPDDLCIDSGSELKEETQANAPPPKPFADSSHIVATSPVTYVATSFSPKLSYSPGPSNDNHQMNLYDPRVLGNSKLLRWPHEFNIIPDNADSFKRRRIYSDCRLAYLK